MTNPQGFKPEILVDSDWKNQAQAEKERLAEAEAKTGPAAGGGAEALPPADVTSLVGMLVTQALMYLGGVADKRTGGAIFDPELSKYYIDLLGVLEEKTRGNLSQAESQDLAEAVHELRGRWVQLTRMVAQQMATGQGAASHLAGGTGTTGPTPTGPPKISLS